MRQSKILLPITLVLALPLVTGCLEETTGIVIFDNGAASVITVSIDGEDVATVEPGHSKPITIDLGERHIQVKHGSQVTYDEKHDFNYGERPYRRPMWILNPDETHCYCDVSVQYGFDEYVAARHDRIARMIESLNEFDDAGDLVGCRVETGDQPCLAPAQILPLRTRGLRRRDGEKEDARKGGKQERFSVKWMHTQ